VFCGLRPEFGDDGRGQCGVAADPDWPAWLVFGIADVQGEFIDLFQQLFGVRYEITRHTAEPRPLVQAVGRHLLVHFG